MALVVFQPRVVFIVRRFEVDKPSFHVFERDIAFLQRLVDGAHQRLLFLGTALAFRQAAHEGHGILAALAQFLPRGPVKPLEQHLDGAVGQAQDLEDLAHHAHRGEVPGIRLFQSRLALGHKEDLFAVGGVRGLNGLDGSLAAHEEGHDGTREHDHFPQGHDRQFLKGAPARCVRHDVLHSAKPRQEASLAEALSQARTSPFSP